MEFLTEAQLESGLDEIRCSPDDSGELKLIVSRPAVDRRVIQESGELSVTEGLVGDTWNMRGSKHTEDGLAHPEYQLNIMNSRAIALVAQHPDRWSLAGDQLFVDLNLGGVNLPVGIQLSIGTAVIEVTSPPHTGCDKFKARFGRDAVKFVNSPVGRELNLRGINAKVVRPGRIRTGDAVKKLPND